MNCGISGCRKKRWDNGTFFLTTAIILEQYVPVFQKRKVRFLGIKYLIITNSLTQQPAKNQRGFFTKKLLCQPANSKNANVSISLN